MNQKAFILFAEVSKVIINNFVGNLQQKSFKFSYLLTRRIVSSSFLLKLSNENIKKGSQLSCVYNFCISFVFRMWFPIYVYEDFYNVECFPLLYYIFICLIDFYWSNKWDSFEEIICSWTVFFCRFPFLSFI